MGRPRKDIVGREGRDNSTDKFAMTDISYVSKCQQTMYLALLSNRVHAL
jgi:hypothetical protein